MKFLFFILVIFIGMTVIVAYQRPCTEACTEGKICINGKCRPREKCKVICGIAANICCRPDQVCITDGCQPRVPKSSGQQ